MQIDVTKLLTNRVSTINYSGNVDISDNLITDTRICSLKDIFVDGTVKLDEENELVITGKLTGIMTLKDDITLEPVEYKFDTDIEETLDSSQFKIDITDILWQNIVVEIPSKVRATSEDIELSGDGWRVISEDTYNAERNTTENPFSTLGELLKTKEDK